MKKCCLIIFIYVVFFLTSCNKSSDINLGKSQNEININIDDTTVESSETITVEENINVFISGCVNNPDVYTLKKGAIVRDVLEMAGGFGENACRDYVNLAGKLEDGEHIIIPDMEEIESGTFFNPESENTYKNSFININTATKEELMSLPGIGERKAEAIIEYRRNKSFSTIEDIMNIPGIKEAAFNKIKDKICIN